MASTCLSRNENPKTIRPTSLHRCRSHAINAFPYNGSLAVSLYSNYACNAAVLASLSASMEAFSLSKIREVGAGTWERAKKIDAGVCIVFSSCLDPCQNLPAIVRAWEMSVFMLVKEELAG